MHLIPVPGDVGGLRAALGKAHRRYTRQVNFREGWRGYLRQGRSASVAMDESYPLAAAYYAELNPVRARLVERAGDWRWSSARAHLDGRDDALVRVAPLLAPVPDGAACRRRVARRVRHGSARPGLHAPTPNDQPIHRLSRHSERHRRAALRLYRRADGAGGRQQDGGARHPYV